MSGWQIIMAQPGREEESGIYGEVQREASTSRPSRSSSERCQGRPIRTENGTGKTANTDVAVLLPQRSASQTAAQSRSHGGPQRIASQRTACTARLAPACLEAYRRVLDRHKQDIFRHLHRPNTDWLTTTSSRLHADVESNAQLRSPTRDGHSDVDDTIKPDTRLAGPEWSNRELSLFYNSLSRHSRWRSDLIAGDLGGSKTIVQIEQYLYQLRKVTRRHKKRDRRLTSRPISRAARQVDNEWIAMEEHLATQLETDEPATKLDAQRTEADQDDIQHLFVLAVFLHSTVASRRQKSSEATEGIPVYPLFHLASCLAHIEARKGPLRPAKGSPTRSFEEFARWHPVPRLQQGKALIQDPSWPYRIVLRLCELGILRRIEHCQTVASCGQFQADDGSKIVLARCYKPRDRSSGAQFQFMCRGKLVTSTQEKAIPASMLDPAQLVFASDLAQRLPDPVSSDVARVATQLDLSRKSAVLRLLASATLAEIQWLAQEPAQTSIVDTPDPATPSTHGKRARGRARTSEYRGHSLVGMTDSEKERFKARIRNKDAREAAKNLERPASRQNVGMEEVQIDGANSPFVSQRSTILAPFRKQLDGLEPVLRKKIERRMYKRIERWGLQGALAAGIGPVEGRDDENDQRQGKIHANGTSEPNQTLSSSPTQEASHSLGGHSVATSPSLPSTAEGLDRARGDGWHPCLSSQQPGLPSPNGDRSDSERVNGCQSPASQAGNNNNTGGAHRDLRCLRYTTLGVARPYVLGILRDVLDDPEDLISLDGLRKHVAGIAEALEQKSGSDKADTLTSVAIDSIDLVKLLPALIHDVKHFVRGIIERAWLSADGEHWSRTDDGSTLVDVSHVVSALDDVYGVNSPTIDTGDAQDCVPRHTGLVDWGSARRVLSTLSEVEGTQPRLDAVRLDRALGHPTKLARQFLRNDRPVQPKAQRRNATISDLESDGFDDQDTSDDNDEVFESHREAAEVEFVRRSFASAPPNDGSRDEAGFWILPQRRRHKGVSEDDSDTDSQEGDLDVDENRTATPGTGGLAAIDETHSEGEHHSGSSLGDWIVHDTESSSSEASSWSDEQFYQSSSSSVPSVILPLRQPLTWKVVSERSTRYWDRLQRTDEQRDKDAATREWARFFAGIDRGAGQTDAPNGSTVGAASEAAQQDSETVDPEAAAVDGNEATSTGSGGEGDEAVDHDHDSMSEG